MARTIPEVFSGTAALDADKVAAITEWYETALADADKAGEVDTAAYWEGTADALRAVLSLVFDSPMYHKCAECHLFIKANTEQGEGIAKFDHLHRGDTADEAIVSTHEAKWSGASHTLDWWREYGPAEMRARFNQGDSDPEPTDCANCGARIEPDDGGAIWFHSDTNSTFCDPDDEDLARQAEPKEDGE